MRFIILGKNIEVTPGLKTAVEDKIGKLEKYFTPETEAHVTLSVEKDRQTVSGHSIMGLMMLGAACFSEIKVACSGKQAREALTALEKLVNDKFNEN